MASQDVQAILAALQAQLPAGMPPQQTTAPPHAQQQPMPVPAYSGVVPTPPPHGSAYPPYSGLPQPAASGSIDLSAIKPVSQGNVNFQDALAKVQGFASARGIPPPSSGMSQFSLPFPEHQIYGPQPTFAAPPPRQDPRLAARPPMDYRQESRTPPRNQNPYRDERRDDPRRHNGHGRERSRSPARSGRGSFAETRDRDWGRDDPDSEVIALDSSLVGLVIGRGGENLKRIEKQTGVRIQFITGPQEKGPTRECRLSGQERSRMDAKQEIWRILEEGGGNASSMRIIQPAQSSADHMRPTPPQLQAVNAPKLREGEDSVQIMVPDRTVGLIIGRGGETIRELQEKSQCHINIVGENKSVNGYRPVNLIGSVQAANHARELILEIVNSDTRDNAGQSMPEVRPQQPDRMNPRGMPGGPDKITEMIYVPSDAVGMIIGKGGETIKQMQNDTGCKINVQQASGQDIERPIELIGDHGALSRAKTVIYDKVEQVKEKNGGRPGGRNNGRNDQSYGNQSYGASNPYGQQGNAQQPPVGQGNPADPYAPYGGYENYTRLWAQYMQQQPGGQPPTQ